MSYKQQIKNSVYEVQGDEIAELLSMPNAIQTYVALNFFRPGLASWGNETIYVSPEVCSMMAYSLKGKPMTLEHPAGRVTAENRDKFMVGAVFEVIRNDQGAYDAKFYLDPKTKDGEEAIDACEWKEDEAPRIRHVSCLYQVERWGDGGTLNGVKYDREVLAGTMLQLALTVNPRYDGTFIVRNSKEEENVVEFHADLGGLDSQIKNEYNESNEQKGETMSFWKKEKVEVSGDLMVDTDFGAKSINELVQIANSVHAKDEEIASLKEQVANAEAAKAADVVANADEKDKKDEDGKDKDQPENACDKKDEVKNADDKEKKGDDDEDEDGKDKDQPKNSAGDLEKQKEILDSQIVNSNNTETKVADNLYAGMARAKADFANN